jgi:phosphatidylinositol glycan class M
MQVITAQYFVWFFCLLPLNFPSTKLELRWRGAALMTIWTAAQLHWLGWAYLLEFKGKNVFLPLWVASLVFFAATIFVMVNIITYHSFSPVFSKGRLVPLPTKRVTKEE